MTLEILIVEDTPENLETAKRYFEKQSDLIVDYAEARDEAIKMLNDRKYGGIIVDRSIPRYKGDNNRDNFTLQANGWSVAFEAEMKDIPWIIFSEHGDLKFYYPKKKNLDKEEIIKEVYEKHRNDNDTRELMTTIFKRFGGKNDKFLCEHEGIKNWRKADPEAWELAYTRLQEQITKGDKK